MKRLGFVLVVVLLAVGFALAGPTAKASAAEEEIKIGALLDFTGAIAFIGPLFKNGIEYAFDEVNWTVAGKKIKLIAEDTASDPTVALEKTKKLVEMDKVKIILGPLMGDQHMSIAPYLKGKKVITATFYCGDSELIPYGTWLIYPTTLVGLCLPVGYYAHDLGYKTMVTLGADYAGGRGFVKGIQIGFKEKGGEVIQELWTPVGTADYGPAISNIKKEADCLAYFLAGPTEQTRFIAQYREFGVKTPLLGTTMDADLPADLLKELGDKVRGVQGQCLYFAQMDTPANKAFQEGMTKKYGNPPGGLENNSYVLAKTAIAGLQATNGDDSFDKLRPAILASKLDTPQGPLSWSPEGVAIVNLYIGEAQEKDGKWLWVPVKTYENVTDPTIKK